MADRAVDLPLVLSSLRRRWQVVVAAAALGAVLGMASVYLWPPMYASASLVLLPPKAADPNQMAELVKTDIRIATSDAVLRPAGRSLQPPMSADELARDVEVTAVTPLVLQVEGRAEEAARAQEISAAVADAHVAYVAESQSSLSNSARALLTGREKELRSSLAKIEDQIEATTARLRDVDPQGSRGAADATALARLTAEQGKIVLQLQEIRAQMEAVQPSGSASVIQQPAPAARPGLLTRLLGAALLGAAVAALLAAAVVILLTRRDSRLYFRDDIADAVGSPVIASVSTRAVTSVAGWIALVAEYAPGTVDAWAWRRALHQLGFSELPSAGTGQHKGRTKRPRSVTVVTLSSDQRGLAMGPELAAFAASAGVRTRLVAWQRHESAATLWAACSAMDHEQEPRPGLTVDAGLTADAGRHHEPRVDLTVSVAVLDRHEPKLLDLPPGSVVVLALTAGSATGVDLARAAVAVDEAGERIHGIIVGDPDHLDRTTGRLLQHDRAREAPLPARTTGSPARRAPRDISDPGRGQR